MAFSDRVNDATRVLRRHPFSTALGMLVIALGVGANAAVFASVHGLLFAPLPFDDPDRIVVLTESSRALDTDLVSPNAFIEWRERNDAFSALAAFMWWENGALGEGADAERVLAVAVSRDYFSVLGVEPLLGRTFTHDDIKAGFSSAMIVSYDLWQRKFGGDPDIIGRTVLADGWQTPIIGVMPPSARNLATGWGDVWRPLRMRQEFDRTQATSARYVRVIARLADQVTVDTALARARGVQRQLQAERPEIFAGYEIRLATLRSALVGEYRPASAVLAGTAGCLLLLTCASLTNMLMARQFSRARDLAVRMAVGASRADLLAQIMSEHVLLVIGGGLGGMLVHQAAVWAIQRWEPHVTGAASLPLWMVALICVVLAGCAVAVATVALSMRSRDLAASQALRDGGRGSTSGQRTQRARQRLVTAEVALAVVLLVVSGLLLRSFVRLVNADPGFSAHGVLVVEMTIPEGQYGTGDERRAYYRRVMEQVRAVPGVISVGGLRYFPMHARLSTAAVQASDNPRPLVDRPVTYWNRVAGDYFQAMGIPLLAGRWPTETEMWERGDGVLVNQRAARLLFPPGEAVGRRVQVGDEPAREILGVVGDVRQAGLGREPGPEVYALMSAGEATGILTLAVRTQGAPIASARAIDTAVRSVDPLLPSASMTPLTTFIGDTVAPRRMAARVGSLFALLSLLLAALGIYALVAQWVSERTAEFGIRMALGATRQNVLHLTVRQGVRLALAGVIVGTVTSLAITRLLGEWFSATQSPDWGTFVAAGALLLLIAMSAALIPGIRATAINPVEALRSK